MTTPHQIAQRLELQDRRLFALESTWFNLEHIDPTDTKEVREVLHRRQGHSTQNLLAALCRLIDTDDQVLLVGHSLASAKHLERQAGDYALKLGLDPRRIKSATARSPGHIGWGPEQVFVDHVVHEFPAT